MHWLLYFKRKFSNHFAFILGCYLFLLFLRLTVGQNLTVLPFSCFIRMKVSTFQCEVSQCSFCLIIMNMVITNQSTLKVVSHYGQRSSNCKKFGFSTLHVRGQSSKAVALQNAYMVVFFDRSFDQSDGFLKEVWVGQECKPKWWRGRKFFSLKNEKYVLLALSLGQRLCINFSTLVPANFLTTLHSHLDVICSSYFRSSLRMNVVYNYNYSFS